MTTTGLRLPQERGDLLHRIQNSLGIATQWQPHFRPTSPRILEIKGEWAGGVRRSRAPFYPLLEAGREPMEIIIPDGTINFSAVGLGGVIDGLPLQSNEYYLIFAFLETIFPPTFAGYGAWLRPRHTGTVPPPGGALGATITITGLIQALRYNVGSRVLIRQSSAALGTPWNQGTILSKTSTTLTVQLDTSVGAIDQANSALPQGSYEIIQLSDYAPLLFSEDSLFPGGGKGYHYAHLGTIITDGSSNIRHAITRGRDEGMLPQFQPLHPQIFNLSVAGTINRQVCLGRWVALGTRYVRLKLDATATGGSPVLFYASSDSAGVTWLQAYANALPNPPGISLGWLPVRAYDTSVFMQLQRIGGGGSVTGTAYLAAWAAEELV